MLQAGEEGGATAAARTLIESHAVTAPLRHLCEHALCLPPPAVQRLGGPLQRCNIATGCTARTCSVVLPAAFPELLAEHDHQ